MKAWLDLRRDTKGQVIGSVQIDEQPEPRPFRGWVELLRLLDPDDTTNIPPHNVHDPWRSTS